MTELDDLLKRFESIRSEEAGSPSDQELFTAPSAKSKAPTNWDALAERLTGVYEQSRRDRGDEQGYLETIGKGLVRGTQGIASGVDAGAVHRKTGICFPGSARDTEVHILSLPLFSYANTRDRILQKQGYYTRAVDFSTKVHDISTSRLFEHAKGRAEITKAVGRAGSAAWLSPVAARSNKEKHARNKVRIFDNPCGFG